jgi:hypothetical protein
MAAPKYELSAHAATVIAERDIELAWVERVLASPTRIEPGRFAPELTIAVGRIAERDGRVLRVVYNASVEPLRIVTVYFDRGLRDKL